LGWQACCKEQALQPAIKNRRRRVPARDHFPGGVRRVGGELAQVRIEGHALPPARLPIE